MDQRRPLYAVVRSADEVRLVHEAVRKEMRRAREEWGPYPPDQNEAYRREGLSMACRWLLGPVDGIGPLSDMGPITSVSRVIDEYELALSLLPEGVSREPRFAPRSWPGARQLWEGQVQGIGQLLGWYLRRFEEIPGFVEPERVYRAA